MMRPPNDLPAVYLCRDAIDFRKGINGLAVLVENTLQLDPFSEQLYVFCNRRRDRIKILYWEVWQCFHTSHRRHLILLRRKRSFRVVIDKQELRQI